MASRALISPSLGSVSPAILSYGTGRGSAHGAYILLCICDALVGWRSVGLWADAGEHVLPSVILVLITACGP